MFYEAIGLGVVQAQSYVLEAIFFSKLVPFLGIEGLAIFDVDPFLAFLQGKYLRLVADNSFGSG